MMIGNTAISKEPLFQQATAPAGVVQYKMLAIIHPVLKGLYLLTAPICHFIAGHSISAFCVYTFKDTEVKVKARQIIKVYTLK